MSISVVSAFDFDNTYQYNPTTKTAYIHNCDFWLGTCFSQGEVLAEATLTWGDTNVGVGTDTHVGTFTYTPRSDKSMIQDLDLTNLKNGQVMTRGKQYKVKTIKQDDAWVLECSGKGLDEICNKVYTDEKINVTEWVPINDYLKKNSFIIGTTYEIGIFVDTQEGDNGDWIPTFSGEQIKEWASFNASVINGLVFGYSFDHPDDSNTKVVDVVRGVYNLTTRGDDPEITVNGVNGSGMAFDLSDKMSDTHAISEIGATGELTICVHVYPTQLSSDMRYIMIDTADDDALLYWNEAGGTDYNQHNIGGGQRYLANEFVLNNWYQQCFVGTNGDEGELWINGVNKTTALIAGVNDIDSGLSGSGALQLGDSTSSLHGRLDEIYVWNRTLSADEIIALQNKSFDFSAPTPDVDTTAPTVTLTIPANASSTSNPNITFNWTVTDDINISNSTLFINGIENATYTFGTGNETTFQVTMNGLNDGSYNWTATARDNSSNQGTTDTWFFTIDAVPPLVSITELGTVTTHVKATNLTINYTVTGGSTCLLEYEGANRSVSCGASGTYINTTDYSKRTIVLWANDTGGNTNVSTITWQYDYFENNITFTSPVTEGDTTNFEVDFIFNDTKFTSGLSGKLNWDGTNYSATLQGTGDNRTLNYTLAVPSVTSTQDKEFYFLINMNNGSAVYYESTWNNQTVNDVNIGTCVTYNVTFMNMTLKDEIDQSVINGTIFNTTVEVEGELFVYGESTPFMNFSEVFYNISYAELCMASALNESQYTLTTLIRYDGDGYASEFYNIQNSTISNSTIPINITLYDLPDANNQVFEIQYKDGNFLPVDDAIIQIQRKYISEGVFKTVEIPKTNFDGIAPANLQLDTVVYTLIVTKNGQVLTTQEDVIAICQNPSFNSCKINLNSYSTSMTTEDYTSLDDFTYTMTYDEDTRTIESVFTVPSGNPSNVDLNVTLVDGLGTNQACFDTLTSASGTLSCVVPTNLGNGTVISNLYKNNQKIAQAFISLEQDPKDLYGTSLVFLGIFITLTIAGVGITDDPKIHGLILILGAILLILFNIVDTGVGTFIKGGATVLWLIIAVTIVLIKGAKR